MAQFTVTVNPIINQPPDAIGIITIYIDDPDVPGFHAIKISEVTNLTSPPYNDPEGDGPLNLKILVLPDPGRGILTHDGVEITTGMLPYELPIIDLGLAKLRYVPVNNIGAYEEHIQFDISDVGSGLYSGLSTGKILFNVGLVPNQNPTIGDGSATMDYQGTLVFTVDMFTTDTVPPFSDPEGDLPYELKILTLPDEPGMKLNGNDCTINQVIPFPDIAAGLFTYTNDDPLDTNGDIQSFTFAIRDQYGDFVE